ncbi:MAG TPA: hypothetical protein DF383_01510, partial [Deltaproteobacteria bacterium]|nr:hypothetical protein [Deltaproteobacteria bacterium]
VIGALSPAGCNSNHDPVGGVGGGDPVPDPNEIPPVMTGGEDGIFGGGINTMFSTGSCIRPVALTGGSMDTFLGTCGSVWVNGAPTQGTGLVEQVNISTGGITARQLKTFLGPNPNENPISLTSTAAGNGSARFTSFEPSSPKPVLLGDPRLLLNSGILSWNENNPDGALVSKFPHAKIRPGGSTIWVEYTTSVEASLSHIHINHAVDALYKSLNNKNYVLALASNELSLDSKNTDLTVGPAAI